VNATYKYLLKADSGYESEQTGKISSERHCIVCAALGGVLSDDLLLLKAAPTLLEAAQIVMEGLNARIADASARGGRVPVFEGIADLHEAIAKATSNSN
jgi:hypothetical protein